MAPLRIAACVLALVMPFGCYDPPQPACGFRCGPVSAGNDRCPDGYSCVGNTCRLDRDLFVECPDLPDPELPDTRPPDIMASSPFPNETKVELDAIILVTFDEDVKNVDAATFGLAVEGEFVGGVVSVASPGRAFRFVPMRNLRANKTYEVVLGNAIADLAGNRIAETRWEFSTIEDFTGPMVVASAPMNGAVSVEPTAAITITFDEPITSNSLSSARLERAGIPETIGLSLPAANMLSISHDPLLGDTLYTIVLTTQITDLAGNPMTPTTLTFTTRDTTPPSIVTRTPVPDVTGVAITDSVSLTFSEPLGDQDLFLSQASTTIDTTITDVINPDDTYTITLAPLTPLTPSTVYTVHVGVVRDFLNNAATFPDYTFTTAP